MAMDKNSSAR